MSRGRLESAGNARTPRDEDGHDAWLRYRPVQDKASLANYRALCRSVRVFGRGAVILSAARELEHGVAGMLGRRPSRGSARSGVILGVVAQLPPGLLRLAEPWRRRLKEDGFLLKSVALGGARSILVLGRTERGVLYGTFRLLRLMQTAREISALNLCENPSISLRMANQWDNPFTRTVERGYAGKSIFDWDALPVLRPRYRDYARMLASVGINGIVLNNVNTLTQSNSGWKLITTPYIAKLRSLASVFRRYGIRTYLSVNFGSPILAGGLDTADPLDPQVIEWWRGKADELYTAVPDFGGFLVKADSEGERGPKGYNRTPAEGANVMARALKPHGGTVFWRTFGYAYDEADRAPQPLKLFGPCDGRFEDNVILQTKYGPIDFHVGEPVSPIFGAMPKTNQCIEVQVTQEYEGFSTHLCWLAPIWRRALLFDTHANGPGSRVVSTLEAGEASPQTEHVGLDLASSRRRGLTQGEALRDLSRLPARRSAVAGVMNVGMDRNWTGHHLAAANTYAFGRLAWNPALACADIADEWAGMTFGPDKTLVRTVTKMLAASTTIYESYTTPLGLQFFCGADHYDPDPAYYPYLHHCDATGAGYDRTVATGSGFTAQYAGPVAGRFESRDRCPDEHLLFFHRLPYDFRMKSGKTLIQTLYDSYDKGVDGVRRLIATWTSLEGRVDERRYRHVLRRLKKQYKHAVVWRDTMVQYFRSQAGSRN
jgi:alpha-glucuronidase